MAQPIKEGETRILCDVCGWHVDVPQEQAISIETTQYCPECGAVTVTKKDVLALKMLLGLSKVWNKANVLLAKLTKTQVKHETLYFRIKDTDPQDEDWDYGGRVDDPKY